MRSRLCLLVLSVFMLAATVNLYAANEAAAGQCMVCHKKTSTGLYNQWFKSAHALHNVTCIDCHAAEKKDADGFEHYGAIIATLVTPKDCGSCHEKEVTEVAGSHHAKAGKILDSNDAYLAHVTGGHPVAIQGCESCHGAKMEIDKNAPNKLSLKTWPNSGIGRINPDGSLGSCNACHTRHSFSKAQARQPEACSKCHLGPDHPQKEIYEASKHGNAYFTHRDDMNLKSDRWIVGEDYYEAPTCASCHMSATSKQQVSHDVGERISWTLRPIVSKKLDNWKEKRGNMQDVCQTCHGQQFVAGHYYQYDAMVMLYNEKFAKPSLAIINLIKEKKLLKNSASFSNKIEWTFWELWHHEGRRARHGAAMMAPDFTWWHGIYEVAQHFYFKFLPEALEYDDPDVNEYIGNMLNNDPMHSWLNGSTADLKEKINSGEMQAIYKNMFPQE
jgi:hydroxylamine dehydrogenase